MRLADIVSFRKDLLFNGAVQIGWYEKDKPLAEKAAQHYIFHGPDYHGVAEVDFDDRSHQLLDTARFTLDILERIEGRIADEPFVLAIAGYGTGKSHLGVTLASLLSDPESQVSNKILDNISRADSFIGERVQNILKESIQPFLVVAINGMQDFDLSSEIIRQIMLALNQRGLDTHVLENLRPRFKTAINFTEAFFDPLKTDFEKHFGSSCGLTPIVERLKSQDEDAFTKVSEIYKQKMGSPIIAVGQESLDEFVRVAKETYCGPGKPYAGILIIFDEFGRYLEFAVQKPHIAGSGALQQLFECVQSNGDGVFLLCFIQYDIKAYISRVAPELREDLNRYVTRYDSVRKVRLSTNLETLIANLLEKIDPDQLHQQIAAIKEPSEVIQLAMKRWFPDINNHAVWMDKERFERIIYKGCWPLHPLSTWVLHRLSSVGKSLQQRSALSLLSDVYIAFQNTDFPSGWTVTPVDLCTEAMINEFLASERYGQQGATAHAYESVLQKYQHELSKNEKNILKAVLVSAKIGIKVESKDDYLNVLAMFSGIEADEVYKAVRSLESEYAVLDWNERLRQYEIAGDAVPKRAFIAYLESKVADIDSQTRSEIFSRNYLKWTQKDVYSTDFGPENEISTREWNYKISYSNVSMLKGQIDYALRTWHDTRGVDEEKGQLIYCYVGAESNIDAIREMILETIKASMKDNGLDWETGAPIAVLLLHDMDGSFGKKIAEYWVLQEQMNDEETQKYANFILDRKNTIEQEMQNKFSELERARHILFATEKPIKDSRIKNMLTELFDVIYHKRIPFPFDGFHTARGNAAKDCQVFTKELFLGNLDKDWISARSTQQRNRAFVVFDQSWQIINDDGSIRLKPANKAMRDIVELLETKLEGKDDSGFHKPMNMGETMRLLCAPPYGCNIASAGLLLALFVGRRKNTLNLLKNNQVIGFENWLRDSMPGSFLDMSVLDITDIVKISQDSISEWEKLLDDWGIETFLLAKVDFLIKAKKLEKRVPVPQYLYYRYLHLSDQAKNAIEKLKECDNKIGSAIDKIEKGTEKDNVSLLSWGAADLYDLYDMMQDENEEWTQQQIKEIENQLANARLQTQQRFPKWLRQQTVHNIEYLSKYKFNMIEKVGANLRKLELIEEYDILIQHVEQVEKYIVFIAEIKRTTSDINNMVQINIITDSTPVSVINNWLEQVQFFTRKLDGAQKMTYLVKDEISAAAKSLAYFQQKCKEQLAYYQDRMNKVFNLEEIASLSDLVNWRAEIGSLIQIYEGQDQNVQDLKLVQKQLDLVEIHYRQIDNDDLSEEEFKTVCEQCMEENENAFSDDAPPLDNELIYGSIIKIIKTKRERIAAEWMQHNVPDQSTIAVFNAIRAMECKTRLQRMPHLLSSDQKMLVHRALQACEDRLDELEIEGLLVKFQSMSTRNKYTFLRKISSYIKEVIKEIS